MLPSIRRPEDIELVAMDHRKAMQAGIALSIHRSLKRKQISVAWINKERYLKVLSF